MPGRSTWRVVVLAIALVGSAASIFGSTTWYSYAHSLTEHSLESELANARAVLGSSMQRDTDLLATVNAVIATHPSIDSTAVGELLGRLGGSNAYPGAFSFSYIQRLRAAGLPGLIAATRRDPPLGIPSAVSGTVPAAPTPGGYYCLTRLAATAEHRLPRAIATAVGPHLLAYVGPGHNYCTSPVASLLAWSARTGLPTVTSLSRVLVSAGGPSAKALGALLQGRSVFAMISPVYGGRALPSTAPARSRAIEGWTLGLFDTSEILRPVTASAGTVALVLEYANSGAAATVLARSGRLPAGATSISIRTGGGTWIVKIALRPRVTVVSPRAEALFIVLGGLLVTTLLAALVDVLIRSRRSALVLVEQRTAELRYQALHDPLTGLPNRLLIGDRAHDLIAHSRAEGTAIAVMFIDLDDFKVVNDNLGHNAGDELLEELAVRLTQSVGPQDTVGRLGGDEFVVLVSDPAVHGGVEALAERIGEVVAEPFSIGDAGKGRVVLSASLGVATGACANPDDLLRDADIALYHAKGAGKGRHVVFDPAMREAVTKKLSLETDLHDAFANGELFLVYQPIVSLRTGATSGVEALLRWRHPARGIVGPDEFIPILETSDLIVDVGRFVLREACRQAREWHDLGWPVGMSVNVAARQLHYDTLVEHVREALAESGLDARYLSVELTESMLLADTATTARRLRALKRLGVQIAIDDFGTGYSSLSYLREFPVDVLKIDRSFVARLDSEDGQNFLDALIHLGRYLGLSTIAEGVEDESQLAHLRGEECEWGQGFLFSRPLDADAVLAAARSARDLGGRAPALATDRT
ncbi:MAG TPA: EAL domain-containing protein [Acidimicrobiales bacterium]|nr:EAL domain-containing protein [Acidimicrobiales bacterium]